MFRSCEGVTGRTLWLNWLVPAALLLLLTSSGVLAQNDPPAEDNTSPAPIPAGKNVIVLFSGKPEELAEYWEADGHPVQWKIDHGALISQKSDIRTKQKFTDYQLHVEFKVPYLPNEKGQARGNSGVFMQDHYEIQILDSYGISDPGRGDCGALYNTSAPLINACKPPLQWQTYDIVFYAPRFDPTTHALVAPGHVTVIQNGLVVQNATEVTHGTHVVARKKNADGSLGPVPPAEDLSGPGAIRLQYHHNSVAFRNIWIMPLPEHGANHY
jgi:hypothetical protein